MISTTSDNLQKVFTVFSLTLWSLSIVSCSKQPLVVTNPPSSERGYLVSYAKTGNMSASEIISINLDEGDISAFATYDIDTYTVVYNTEYLGQVIEVSGLVMVPLDRMGTLGWIQNHHGTIIPGFGDEETPSTYTGGKEGSSEMYFVGATFASNGYLVSMPDYLGYGLSADQEHPYTMHRPLADFSVDMLRATKQLATQIGLNLSSNVFLTGWSEGGGAGLATHKHLQEQNPGEFQVLGSSLLAGPYDYFEFMKDILSKPDKSDEELSIYNWSVYALNKDYPDLQRNPSSIWTYPVSAQEDAIYVPSNKVSEIYTPTFVEGIVNEMDTDFIAAAKANTLLEGWTPKGELFFHSGTNDLIVPHYNSTNAHNFFRTIGVQSTLYEYPNGDHYTPLYQYVTTTLNDFNSIQ